MMPFPHFVARVLVGIGGIPLLISLIFSGSNAIQMVCVALLSCVLALEIVVIAGRAAAKLDAAINTNDNRVSSCETKTVKTEAEIVTSDSSKIKLKKKISEIQNTGRYVAHPQFYYVKLILTATAIYSIFLSNLQNPPLMPLDAVAAIFVAVLFLVFHSELSILSVNVTAKLLEFLIIVFGVIGYSAGLAAAVRLYWQVGPSFVLYILLSTFLIDTGALITGSLISRKHHLSTQLSPNKSYEGLAGSLASAAVADLVCYHAFLPCALALVTKLAEFGVIKSVSTISIEIPLSIRLCTQPLLGICGAIGDLVESWLKRAAGIKDSSKLFGEHGGILDRTDSLFICFPLISVLVSALQ